MLSIPSEEAHGHVQALCHSYKPLLYLNRNSACYMDKGI